MHISWNFLYDYIGKRRMLFWCTSIQDMENEHYARLRRTVQNILVDFANSGNEQHFYRYGQYYYLLHLLVDYFMVSDVEGTGKGETDHLVLLADYLEENYGRDVSLKEVADFLHLSVSYVSRYVKQRMGMNFVDYLYQIRLEHAVEELLYSDKGESEILKGFVI